MIVTDETFGCVLTAAAPTDAGLGSAEKRRNSDI